jgi:aspartate/methionine/tyrosine aminotransferase
MNAQTVSQRMNAVQAPIIPVVAEWIRAHPGTLSLGQGVAWYGPPDAARARLGDFFGQLAHHKYGAAQGIPELLELIELKLETENGIRLHGRRAMVTAGANMGFLNALFAIADPGDEIVLPVPYYFNQEMAVSMLNCVPIFVPTDADFRLRPEAMRAALTERTRAIVTISPNNPSGAVYAEADLRAVNALCQEAGIYHISDEAYENFLYDGARHFSPASIPGSENHTIALYSLSKAYGFASWRIGYMAFPEHLYPALLKAQDTNLICPPLISQYAAVGALETGSGYCREKLQTTARVREQVLAELEALDDFCHIPPSNGAFYILLKVDASLDSMRMTERLIREHRVAVIPGAAFGLEDSCHLRIAYGALDETTAVEGIKRLAQGLRALRAEHI